MPASPRCSWPIPQEYSDPWYDKFVALVTAIDAAHYTTREDKNFLLLGGGTVTFTDTTGVMSWSAPLEAVAATTGYHWYSPTPLVGGSVTLQDGEFLYVELTRAPQSSQSLTPLVGSRISVSDDAFVLAQRIGSVVVWRNGVVVPSGMPVILFGPTLLFRMVETVGTAGLQSTDQTNWVDVGGLYFDPTELSVGGGSYTRTVKFEALLETTDAAISVECRLNNVTSSTPVTNSLVTSVSLAPEFRQSVSLTVAALGDLSPAGAVYAVQLRAVGAMGPTDAVTCRKAALKTRWS